jgi:LmbE family N-acetylglucosaminyl deacetylase
MKPTPNSPTNLAPLVAFGAHPDDIEFGCGAIIALETLAGRPAHLVVCSQGESASHGTPARRKQEAETSAAILAAKIEFVKLDGDAHLELRAAHAIQLAGILRRIRPGIVLAPSAAENQHPDHSRLGNLVRDAARLARYGGIEELRASPAHAIDQLLFYTQTPESEPRDISPILIDISDPEIVAIWTRAMEAHASQASSRKYIELQLTRARLRGLSAGVEHAIALFPNDPPIFNSLSELNRSARQF